MRDKPDFPEFLIYLAFGCILVPALWFLAAEVDEPWAYTARGVALMLWPCQWAFYLGKRYRETVPGPVSPTESDHYRDDLGDSTEGAEDDPDIIELRLRLDGWIRKMVVTTAVLCICIAAGAYVFHLLRQ